MLPFTLSILLLQSISFLDPYQWKNRVLLIYVENALDSNLKKQLATLQEANGEYEERDVKVFYIIQNQIFTEKGKLITSLHPTDPLQALRPKSFGIVLIGKDGGKKIEAKNVVTNEFIFERIDAMPMRKSEQQKKQ